MSIARHNLGIGHFMWHIQVDAAGNGSAGSWRFPAAQPLLPVSSSPSPKQHPGQPQPAAVPRKPRAELGLGELPRRGHRCPRATRTVSWRWHYPGTAVPASLLGWEADVWDTASPAWHPQPPEGATWGQGQPTAEHPLAAQHIPAAWPPVLCPPSSTAPANIYPPRSGVYKAQLISVCNAAMSLCRAGWQRCSGTA